MFKTPITLRTSVVSKEVQHLRQPIIGQQMLTISSFEFYRRKEPTSKRPGMVGGNGTSHVRRLPSTQTLLRYKGNITEKLFRSYLPRDHAIILVCYLPKLLISIHGVKTKQNSLLHRIGRHQSNPSRALRPMTQADAKEGITSLGPKTQKTVMFSHAPVCVLNILNAPLSGSTRMGADALSL